MTDHLIPAIWNEAILKTLKAPPLYLITPKYHSGLRGWLEHHLPWLFYPEMSYEPNPEWWGPGSAIGDVVHIPKIENLAKHPVDQFSRARQSAHLEHAEVIIRALLDLPIVDFGVEDGHAILEMNETGKKWFDRAEEWLKEYEHSKDELVSQP